MKKISVTIAIPAYNEEYGIVQLLKSIKKQKQSNYVVDSIKVYSDGSTDQTVDLVRRSFKDVIVIDSKKNMGKNVRVNQIMKDNKSGILVQIDADVTIKRDDVIENLISPMLFDKNIGISCAYHLANTTTTFVGALSLFGFQVWNGARAKLGTKGARYYCEGGMRAFSKKFTKEFQLPINKHIGEDSYSFYYAVKKAYKVAVAKKSVVYIDLAENYSDYMKQMKRFLIEPQLMEEAFGKKLISKFETMTTAIKFRVLLEQIIKNPMIGIMYIPMQALVKIQSLYYKPPVIWQTITRK